MFPIVNALRSQFSWTHYKLLIRISDEDKRTFYIAEATKNLWTARQLERENSTIGILLCTDKNNAVVKYTLPQNNQSILASHTNSIYPKRNSNQTTPK